MNDPSLSDPSLSDPPSEKAPQILQDWVDRLAAELDLAANEVDIAEILDLAKIAAHSVARPAAPLTTFLAGLAAGRAGGHPNDIREAISAAAGLALAAEK